MQTALEKLSFAEEKHFSVCHICSRCKLLHPKIQQKN